jgi:DNA polymerase III gamma/tau subunit
MASQALYRKWRSQTFQELIGQEAVVQTLKNELQSGRVVHAYLFCGPRGTGKTSAARLLAKTLNCQNPQSGEPCNVCPNCREITENRSLDVIEIDAASNRGIDEIRDLRERVAVRPVSGKYKLYVLDEAHMLTEPAFNALLKTLEEPPPYVICWRRQMRSAYLPPSFRAVSPFILSAIPSVILFGIFSMWPDKRASRWKTARQICWPALRAAGCVTR